MRTKLSTETTNNTNNQHEIPQLGDNLSQYESHEKYVEALNLIKDEINANHQFANESNDWREIRNRLNISKDKLKGLFLKDEDNTSMLDLINTAIELVNRRQADETELFEKESFNNYNNVIDKVRDLIEKSKNNTDFKQARHLISDAQNLFKKLTLKRTHKDELNKIINDAYDTLSARQIEEKENYEMECIENYHNLKKIIENAIEFTKITNSFTKSREKLIAAQSQIKGKVLKRDQREELYQTIRNTFEEVNARQDNERQAFEGEIVENYNKLKTIVDEACEFAKNTDEFNVAKDQLINAQNAIKGVKIKRSQRDELYSQIRAVFDDLSSRQNIDKEEYEKECLDNFNKLTSKIDDSFALILGVTDFKLIRESLMLVQSEVKIAKLKRDHRTELFNRIRDAYHNFDKKRDEYFSKRNNDRKDKLKIIVAGLTDKINRLNEQINKDTESLNLLNKKLEEVSNDEKAQNETKSKISNINARIEERNKTIEEANTRIDGINQEIEQIK